MRNVKITFTIFSFLISALGMADTIHEEGSLSVNGSRSSIQIKCSLYFASDRIEVKNTDDGRRVVDIIEIDDESHYFDVHRITLTGKGAAKVSEASTTGPKGWFPNMRKEPCFLNLK